MSDTTDSSPGSPTLCHIGNTENYITTANSTSATDFPTLSGIAKELLLVGAHYATEKASYQKQIEEFKSRIKGQTRLIYLRTKRIKELDLEIRWQERLIEHHDEETKRSREVIDGYREALEVSYARVDTLLAQRLASLGVPIDVLSDKRENSPVKSVSTPEATTRLLIGPAVSTPTMTTDTIDNSVSTPETTTHALVKPAVSTLTTTTSTLVVLSPTPESNLPLPDKPAVSTLTTTTDTPGIPLPTPKTSLYSLGKPPPPPTLNLYHEPNYTFGNATPFFRFDNPTLVYPVPASQSKSTPRLTPHRTPRRTRTRSKSADARISLPLAPFFSQPFKLEV